MLSKIANWVFLWVVIEKLVGFFRDSKVLAFVKRSSIWLWRLGKGIVIYALIGAVCGTVVFLLIGGMGLALMGIAVGIGILPLAFTGVVVALAIMNVVNTWREK